MPHKSNEKSLFCFAPFLAALVNKRPPNSKERPAKQCSDGDYIFYGKIVWVRHLAPPNGFAENVRVQTVIIAELGLGNVDWQVPFADFMVGADHGPLHQRPEAFNRVCVNRANNIVALRMVNSDMREVLVQVLVANPLIQCRAS